MESDQTHKEKEADGSSKKQTAAKHPHAPSTSLLPQDVKDLGRKARARLREELSKRPEIVRVELPPPVEKQTQTSKTGGFVDTKIASKIQIVDEASSHPRKRRRHHSSSVRPTETEDKNADTWVPDTFHLSTCSKATRSNVVMLHGLPLGTTAGQIRRFFSGLDPQRILLLPSNPATILDWDAKYKGNRNKGGVAVQRYPPVFRVLVKFHAAPTAELAVKRSGEVLSIENKDDEEMKGASIAVTQMLKPMATYLLRHLVIDGETSVPLESTLKKIEEHLDPIVIQMLWASTIKDLDLKFETSSEVNNATFPLHIAAKNAFKPANYSKLLEQSNTLKKERDKLYYQLPFPSAECLDLEMAADPIVRLTSCAADCLLRESERIDELLQQAKQRRLFLPKEAHIDS